MIVIISVSCFANQMPQKFSFVQIPHNKECWEVDWVYLHGTNYCNVHEKTLMSRLPRIS